MHSPDLSLMARTPTICMYVQQAPSWEHLLRSRGVLLPIRLIPISPKPKLEGYQPCKE